MTRKHFIGGVFHSDFARLAYEELGVEPSRLEVVHNGFDPARFEVDPGTAEARRRSDIDAEGLVVAYTGRVNLKKGLGIVLDLAERHTDVTFLIVGSESNGEVERRAAELDNVIVKPWASYSELPDYLFAADVLMIPPSQGPLARGPLRRLRAEQDEDIEGACNPWESDCRSLPRGAASDCAKLLRTS